jgi:DNA topoisomerase-1
MSRRSGWRRRGSRGRFRYVDASGLVLDDPDHLERIAALAIPPSWSDVWISPSARAKVQATGFDLAGRRQYRYHAGYRAAQERAKFDRLVPFGEQLPVLRKAVSADMDAEPTSRDRICALAVKLINETWFRVGSDRYAERSRTFGVTTLAKRHVSVRGRTVRFSFRGKHSIEVRTTLVDEELAVHIRELLGLRGGPRLFRYANGHGVVPLRGPVLNDYVREYMGPEFTAKDFRTWGGTLSAAIALAEHGPPATPAEATRALGAAMKTVARKLGNTPAIARSSYVSPVLVEHYRAGRTIEEFRPRRQRAVAAREQDLTVEERALLSLLRTPVG